MAAIIITSVIPEQTFELFRDQLALVISTEMAAQWGLDNTQPRLTGVYVERFIATDGATEDAVVNVSIHRVEYSNKVKNLVNGEYVFNIDIYTARASSAENGAGDQYAMMQMSRIAAMIRYILSVRAYDSLGLAPGLTCGVGVLERFVVLDKNTVKDALSDVFGRLQYKACLVEYTGDTATGVALARATTKVKMIDGAYGFYYDFNPVA